MRPDEHKKKRSAQYKKKHGDKVDKPKNTKQTDTKKNATQNDAQKSGSFPQTVASRTVGDDKKTDSACSSATSRDSEFEPLDEWEQQKSFRRRQVVSNWERYEGTASLTEDTPTLRGADFKAIVEAGGNAFSQFRFRDEQLWEEEEEEPVGEETPKCLAIDCEDLASALLCLPLHERLCVDKAAFQEDQIVLFNELATTHQAAYEQRLHEVPSKTDTGAGSMFEDIVQSTSPDSSLIDRCSDTSQSEDILDDILRASDVNSLMEKVVLDSDSRGEDETRQILEDDDNSVKDSVILSGSAQTLEHERNRASGDCKNAENAEPTQATENTTSVILTESALHNKLAETVTQTDSTERKVLDRDESQKSVTCIEDELDFLLTLDVPVSKEEKSTQPTGNSDTGQSDSLDDWLDDMLAS